MKKQKRIILFLIVFLLVVPQITFGAGARPPVATYHKVLIYLDDKYRKIPEEMGVPFLDIRTERTMVPIRYIAEALGCNVEYLPRNQKGEHGFHIARGDRSSIMYYDNNKVHLKIGEESGIVKIDAAAYLYDGRSYVPLRFISEALGHDVVWRRDREKGMDYINILPEGKRYTKPKPQPDPKPIPNPEPNPIPRPDPEPLPQPDPKPIPRPDPKPMPKPNPKPVGDPTTIKDIAEYKRLVSSGLKPEEAELAVLINEYRVNSGLPALPISKSLTEVARTHVMDSNQNQPEYMKDERGIQANLHSWSYGSNRWTGVAYTGDHKYAEGMWCKPRELTSYTGNGYEISYKHSNKSTPLGALKGWQSSPGHNAVITGQGLWSDLTTFGVGIGGNYAHVWWGKDDDPEGYY